ANARQADPGLPQAEASALAHEAWTHLRDLGGEDVAAIARALLAGPNAPEVTHANVIARAAVDHCLARELDLS
ncbi:MAG: hypothetical protein ABIO67_01640, partial [Mycobacteriales bacterium]